MGPPHSTPGVSEGLGQGRNKGIFQRHLLEPWCGEAGRQAGSRGYPIAGEQGHGVCYLGDAESESSMRTQREHLDVCGPWI